MARINTNIFYAEGSLWIRRSPSNSKVWQVLDAKAEGKGSERTLTGVQVLKDNVESGKVAREVAKELQKKAVEA